MSNFREMTPQKLQKKSQTFNPSDTKGFGTISDTKGFGTTRIPKVLEPHRIPRGGGGGWADPLLSHNSLDLGT